jgi:hypothetical protein
VASSREAAKVSVAEIQNTTATILRGTTTNQFGDEIDDNQPLVQHLPVFLAETGKTVQDPSTPTPRTIRQITCTVPQYVGITNEDRIKDEATGDTYIIIGVTTPPTIIGAPVDLVLDLKRISAQAS